MAGNDDVQAKGRELKGLIGDVFNGALALPEFQRDFVWRPAAVKLLLCSIAKDWPIGSFMIWERPDIDLAVKRLDVQRLDEAKPKGEVSFLLDGQQRLTGIIYAFNHDSSDVKYIMKDVVAYLTSEPEGDIEDHIEHRTSKQYGKSLGTVRARAKADVALIEELSDERRFSSWRENYYDHHGITTLEAKEKLDLDGRRAERLPGLKHYYVPIVQLQPGLSLEAVARIFETTNKTGVKLNTVDLMIARLFPHDFFLRDEWEEACRKIDSEWKYRYGNTLDAEDVLRILAYWHSGGSGVTRDRILKLKPDSVKADWERAVAAFGVALEFLRDELGVVQESLLPARLLILPLAVALDVAGSGNPSLALQNAGLVAALKRWFWKMIIEETFARSTNTRAIGQAKELVALVEQGNYAGAFVAQDRITDKAKTDLQDRLLDEKGSDGLLEAATQALVVSRGGKDWDAGRRGLEQRGGRLQRHHIVPDKAKEAKSWTRRNCIANLTPQSEESNLALGNRLPSEIEASGSDLLGPHLCDFGEFGKIGVQGFESFAKRRSEALAEVLLELAYGRSE